MRLYGKISDLFKATSQDTEQLLGSLIENVSDIIVVIDSAGRITRHSKSFEVAVKNKGLSSLPKSFSGILDEPGKFEYKKLVEYIKRENKPVTDFRIKTIFTSGSRESLLSIIPTGSIAESTLQLLHVLRSTNDHESDAPDFGHIEKLTNVGQIAAGIAHELNTPLGSIVLSAEYVMEAVTDKALAQEAERIKSRAVHCSKVVKELLGYVRHDDRGTEKYNLLEIVNKVTDLVLSDAKRKNIELVINDSDGDAIIDCNENQVQQLLFNLISNATHAIGRDGRIDISFRLDQLLNRIYIIITDNGSGIAPAILPKIFEPFFTTKPGTKGTGLGLALCKKIILEHGGDISVRSVVGEGTTFEVWMPLDNE